MNVSKSIKIILISKGISKGDLAKAMDVAGPTVSRWCHAEGQCSTPTVERLAKFFDMKVSEFIAVGE